MKDFYASGNYAEKAVIGSLLADNSTWNEVGDYLRADDFSEHLHRESYRVIQNLLLEGKNADAICVAQFLFEEKIMHDDPFVQLCEILQAQFTPLNIKYYAEIVRQKSLDNKLIATAKKIITSVCEQKENRLDHAQQSIAEITNERSSNMVLVADMMKKVLHDIDERSINPSGITGIATGYLNLDEITHGMQCGDLIILAGRPGMGKTILAMNVAEHVALSENKPVAIFSLEMSKEKLLERSFASVGNIEADQIQTGNLDEHNLEKLSSIIPKFQKAKLFIDDRSFLRVSDIRATCRRLIHECKLSLIIIDYIGLMSSEGENETIRISNISRGLKLLARDLNVPVIAISQLNRSVEQRANKRPCIADLRQSGAIEQDADLILFVYRDEAYHDSHLNKGMAELIIAKHRNGEVGTIYLNFNNKYCRFDSCSNVPQKKEKVWAGGSLIY